MKTTEIIDKIIDALFKEMDYCGHCGRSECKDHSYRKLPGSLNTETVLKVLDQARDL